MQLFIKIICSTHGAHLVAVVYLYVFIVIIRKQLTRMVNAGISNE